MAKAGIYSNGTIIMNKFEIYYNHDYKIFDIIYLVLYLMINIYSIYFVM
jgi:hypothetical protein